MPKAKFYTAFNKTLTIRDWLDQPECQHDNYNTLKDRFQKYPPEEALSGGYVQLYEYNGVRQKWSYWKANPPVQNINWRTIRTRMDAQVPLPKMDAAAVLHLRPGGWNLVPVQTSDEAFTVFLALKEVMEWEKRLSKAVIGKPIRHEEAA